MKTWTGTDKRDPDAIQRIDYFLRDVNAAMQRISMGQVPSGGGGSIGGVTDHGVLLGLADDDHLQYVLLNGRSGNQAVYGSSRSRSVSDPDASLTLYSEHSVHASIVQLESSDINITADDIDIMPLDLGHSAHLTISGTIYLTSPDGDLETLYVGTPVGMTNDIFVVALGLVKKVWVDKDGLLHGDGSLLTNIGTTAGVVTLAGAQTITGLKTLTGAAASEQFLGINSSNNNLAAYLKVVPTASPGNITLPVSDSGEDCILLGRTGEAPAAGELFYGTAVSGHVTPLAIGTIGHVLTVNTAGTLPEWKAQVVVDATRTWTTKQTFPTGSVCPRFNGNSEDIGTPALEIVDNYTSPLVLHVLADAQGVDEQYCVLKSGEMISSGTMGTLAALTTGLLKSTTTTGVLSIAAKGDLPAHNHTGSGEGGVITLPSRDSLGLDTDDSPQFAGINLGHASDTTLARSSAGEVTIETQQVVRTQGSSYNGVGVVCENGFASIGDVYFHPSVYDVPNDTTYYPHPAGFYRIFVWMQCTTAGAGDSVKFAIAYPSRSGEAPIAHAIPMANEAGTYTAAGVCTLATVAKCFAGSLMIYSAGCTTWDGPPSPYLYSSVTETNSPVITVRARLEYLGA
jgi:hypothetical protein